MHLILNVNDIRGKKQIIQNLGITLNKCKNILIRITYHLNSIMHIQNLEIMIISMIAQQKKISLRNSVVSSLLNLA